jgi:DNA-binding MarR family transcriptional regulator
MTEHDAQGQFPSVGDRVGRANTTTLLGEAFLKLGALIAAGAAEAGYPQRPSHSVVFAHIDTERGSRLTELAARSSITPPSMSDVVDNMVRRGYVERRPDPTDRRAKRIFLTPGGLESLHAGLATIERIEMRLQELLGEGELENLRCMLRRIIQAPIRP